MTSRKTWLIAKVANEGYCCPNAYLRLCKARGESVQDMAKNIGVSPHTLWYHYRKFKGGVAKPAACQRLNECMDSVVKEIEDEKTPAEAGEKAHTKKV